MLHKNITIGGMITSALAVIISLSQEITTLSGPLHVLAVHNAGKIVAAAAVVSGIGSVIAGLGRSPLEK